MTDVSGLDIKVVSSKVFTSLVRTFSGYQRAPVSSRNQSCLKNKVIRIGSKQGCIKAVGLVSGKHVCNSYESLGNM